jgi:methyltransferase (TIGR00027 family)
MKRNAEAGRSAYGAASMKATEAFVPAPQRLFEDKIVMDLLPWPVQFLLRRSVIRAVFLSLLEASAPGIRGAMLCRTRRIDDAVRNAIHQGLPAFVILGAGLDTRPYRFTEFTDVSIVEIDLPSVQEHKKTCLLRKFGALPRHVRFVPGDLNKEQLDTTLESCGLNPSEPAIFLWEGVSQYLRPNAVDSVLCTIAKRPKGTVLVFTYVLQEVITGAYRSDRSEAFRKSASRQPEPWHFGVDPRHLRAFLTARGLSLRHDFGAEEHQKDYLRPVERKLEVSEIERVAIAIV